MNRLLAAGLLALAVSGCASVTTSATNRMADNLNAAMRNQDDPETVRAGAPAYLLMIDSLIESDPRNQSMLLGGARLYGSYATAFVTDPARAQRLAARSMAYGKRALCLQQDTVCAAVDEPFKSFEASLASVSRDDIPALYGYTVAWAGWIEANRDDWNAIADIARIKAAMLRVVELDESWDDGGAQAYLGVLSTLLPASLGGKPEEGRQYFERAITLSGNRNLMYKVLFARHYARLVFDRPLHDRLLGEVMAADPVVKDLTLINTLAQQQAQELLDGANDYF